MSKIYIIRYGTTDSYPELNWDATLFATTSKEKAGKIVEIFEKYNEENHANWSIDSRSFEDKLAVQDNLRRDAKQKLCEIIDTDRYDKLFPDEDHYLDAPEDVWVEEQIVYD